MPNRQPTPFDSPGAPLWHRPRRACRSLDPDRIGTIERTSAPPVVPRELRWRRPPDTNENASNNIERDSEGMSGHVAVSWFWQRNPMTVPHPKLEPEIPWDVRLPESSVLFITVDSCRY